MRFIAQGDCHAGFTARRIIEAGAPAYEITSNSTVLGVVLLAVCVLPSSSFAQFNETGNFFVNEGLLDLIKADIAAGCREHRKFPHAYYSPGHHLVSDVYAYYAVSLNDYNLLKSEWEELPRAARGRDREMHSTNVRPTEPVETNEFPLPQDNGRTPVNIPPGNLATLILDVGGGGITQRFKLTGMQSGATGGPLSNGPTMSVPAHANGTPAAFGANTSWILGEWPRPMPTFSSPFGYAPEDKPASGFPSVLPTKAPPKPAAPTPRFTFNVEAGNYGFAGGKSTINGIPGGPGITPTGDDSFISATTSWSPPAAPSSCR